MVADLARNRGARGRRAACTGSSLEGVAQNDQEDCPRYRPVACVAVISARRGARYAAFSLLTAMCALL